MNKVYLIAAVNVEPYYIFTREIQANSQAQAREIFHKNDKYCKILAITLLEN